MVSAPWYYALFVKYLLLYILCALLCKELASYCRQEPQLSQWVRLESSFVENPSSDGEAKIFKTTKKCCYDKSYWQIETEYWKTKDPLTVKLYWIFSENPCIGWGSVEAQIKTTQKY